MRSGWRAAFGGGPPTRSAINLIMSPWDDDDDWVGTPPEGRYSRDRAKPEYWRRLWPRAGVGMALLLVIVVIVLIVR